MDVDDQIPDTPAPEPAPTAEPAPEPPVVEAAQPPAPDPDPMQDPVFRAALEAKLAQEREAMAAQAEQDRQAAKAEAISELEAAAKKEAELAAMTEQQRLQRMLEDERAHKTRLAAEKARAEADKKDADARIDFLRALGSSAHQLADDPDFEKLAYERAKRMAPDGKFATVIPDLAAAHPALFRQAAPSASATTTTSGSSAPRGATVAPAPPSAPPGKDAMAMSTAEWAAHKRSLGIFH